MAKTEETLNVQNNLYPVFLKLENLHLLIVGGGFVGTEKMTSVMNCSPDARVTVVAKEISADIRNMVIGNDNVVLLEKPFEASDLDGKDLVFAATADRSLNAEVKAEAAERGILANVADTPDLCDFYLSSIVNKGHLKIAVSTNGKSPTVAKRLKEVFNEMLPDELEQVLDNMQHIRQSLNGDFHNKVQQLNSITKVLVENQTPVETPLTVDQPPMVSDKKWKRIVTWCIFAFVFMIIGHAVLSYIPFKEIADFGKTALGNIDHGWFLLMLLTGFLAQFVDGALGMGYGVISTSILLSVGVNPAIVSSRVHSARVFSSAVSGYSHRKFGNVNKKLFKALVVPGCIGAIGGAVLAVYAKESAHIVRPILSVYTLYLGIRIITKAFAKRKKEGKIKNAGWLASAGGFMDAFAGGGWGSLVTSTLLSKAKNPRYIVGSVCLTEFFVVLSSTLTFFILLKSLPLTDIAGLIIGGLIAAPIAARLVGKIPMKYMLFAVGGLVSLSSVRILWMAVLEILK